MSKFIIIIDDNHASNLVKLHIEGHIDTIEGHIDTKEMD